MEEKNIFDTLENNAQSVIDRLAAEFPPQNNEEKERIFNMSERKFNDKMKSISNADEQSVSGVEIYKKPSWQRFVSIAAALTIVAGGITGGVYALKHIKGDHSITTNSEDENKIAPFGNFAEFDYHLCGKGSENIKSLIIQSNASPDATDFMDFRIGAEISQEKRKKIADFLNNYDYGEPLAEADALQAVFNTALSELDEEELPEGVKENAASDEKTETNSENKPDLSEKLTVTQDNDLQFIYFDNNEIRTISICNTVDYGVLTYTHYTCEERDDIYYTNERDIETKHWKIDYELFKTTINDILSVEDENNVETPTEEPAKVSNCPFDLAAHDFYIADPYSNTRIEIKLNSSENETIESEDENIPSTHYHLIGGNVISPEKRKKLAEFFNDWNWEECDEYDYPPHWLCTYDEKGLFCIEDNEAFIISFDRDTDTMFFTKLQIKLNYDSGTSELHSNDEQRYITYDVIGDPSSIINKRYKIDYALFISKLKEVLGDDFTKYAEDQWSFVQKDWSLQTDEHDTPAALSADAQNNLYDMFRKYQFKEEEVSNERLSAAEAMEIYNNTPPAESNKYAILTCDYYDYHDIIYFETKDDKTLIRYYDYGIQGENIPNNEYNVNITTYSCDDKTLVDKIKEYS